jgi:hypothetical protein
MGRVWRSVHLPDEGFESIRERDESDCPDGEQPIAPTHSFL